jgi:hypothetical protein
MRLRAPPSRTDAREAKREGRELKRLFLIAGFAPGSSITLGSRSE